MDQILTTLLECNRKKRKRGFTLKGVDIYGVPVTFHTFKNYSKYLSKSCLYTISYKNMQVTPDSYGCYVLLKDPEIFGNMRTSNATDLVEKLRQWAIVNDRFEFVYKGAFVFGQIKQAVDAYLANPDRFSKHDDTEVWSRLDLVKRDINRMYAKDKVLNRGTEFIATYNKKYAQHKHDKFSDNNDKYFCESIDSIDRDYRIKAKHLTTSGILEDSVLTNLLQTNEELLNEHGELKIDVNNFPKTGVLVNMDAAFNLTCLRERFSGEWYIYFAVATYMKKSRRFPVAQVKHVEKYLQAFLKEKKEHFSKLKLLKRMIKKGFFKLSTDSKGNYCIAIVSQKKIVHKYEAAWKSKNRRAFNGTQKRVYIDKKDRHPMQLKQQFGQALGENDQTRMDNCYKPYFDISYAKTCKIDSGFINLLFSNLAHQKAFLYESIVSSWDENRGFCRTRIGQNLLISPSTQRLYERKSQYLEKRYNHTELTEALLNTVTQEDYNYIDRISKTGGKFKRSPSGTIYRQEGNTYRSSRFSWKSSKNCARHRLSPTHIRTWAAIAPIFVKETENVSKTIKVLFKPVQNELLDKSLDKSNGQLLSTIHISKKKDMKKNYFALSREGVSITSTNPNNWESFIPCLELDNNGDRLIVTPNSIDPHLGTVARREEANNIYTPSSVTNHVVAPEPLVKMVSTAPTDLDTAFKLPKVVNKSTKSLSTNITDKEKEAVAKIKQQPVSKNSFFMQKSEKPVEPVSFKQEYNPQPLSEGTKIDLFKERKKAFSFKPRSTTKVHFSTDYSEEISRKSSVFSSEKKPDQKQDLCTNLDQDQGKDLNKDQQKDLINDHTISSISSV